MKKALGVLSAVLMLFACVTTVSAADDDDYNLGEGHCYNCKCARGTVDCPGTRSVTGVQGSTSYVTDPAYPFDFDGRGFEDGGFGSFGYCTGYNYDEDTTRNCKVVFDVCSCADACNIEPGLKMGIQMYIETEGVYFADPDMDTIHFDMFASINETCAKNSLAQPTITTMAEAPYFRDENDQEIPGEADSNGNVLTTTTGWEVRNFGRIEYYWGVTDGDNVKGKFESTPYHKYGTTEAPMAGASAGAVPNVNRVRVLQSFEESDYMFTAYDTRSALGNCKIWIDVPAMRIDPTVAQEGAVIKLRTRLLFNRRPAGICKECDPPDICQCVTEDIGVVCCDTTVPVSGEYCMFFPYVIQGMENTNGWSTGIAVSARNTTMPDDAWVQLELRDTQGTVSTYKREWGGSGLVWAFVVDNQLTNFDKTLVAGPSALKVTSNFSMDGYQFMNANQTFGAGSNARGCKAGQCCPQ
jgi:hypothetical protein